MLTPNRGEHVIFPIADGTAELFGRDRGVRESILRRDEPVMSEDLRAELQGNLERSQPTETKDDAEARNDFWSKEGDFIYRHHVEPQVHLYVLKEESFPISLKYIDVTRNTHTNLEVLQEKRIDDCWNVDVTGFTKFTLLNQKPPQGYMWSGRRLSKIEATTRPGYL